MGVPQRVERNLAITKTQTASGAHSNHVGSRNTEISKDITWREGKPPTERQEEKLLGAQVAS